MTTTSKIACPPRYGTTRTPERETLGHAVAHVAELLGVPLMPWQRYVVDVLLEIDPLTGRLAYSEFGLTVPRQSGKSILLLAKAIHRASASGFFGKRQSIVYTAQTRKDARKKFEKDYAAVIEASPVFRHKADPRWGNGNEHIRFPNGSRFEIEASTEKAGHGGTIDEVYIDEAFAQVDTRLEQAFGPAMITRHNKQLGVVSTAGWLDGSPYLLEKVQRGREHVEMGMREGLAYFEWSAPDDADPEDRDVWRACMPALGHTITEEAIAHEFRTRPLNDFRRAYLNQWVAKDDPGTETVVDMGTWALLEDVEQTRPNPVAFSIEVSKDRKWSSIGLAGRRSDGNRHVQIVQAGRGTGWVPERVAELVHQWKPLAVAVNPSGPAGSLLAPLAAAGVDVLKVGPRDVAQACGLFVDAVDEGTIRHDGQRQVTASLGAARKRASAEAYTFGSSDPGIDIAPLRAVALALYALVRGTSKKQRSGKVW